jgi:diguanylate cyclase
LNSALEQDQQSQGAGVPASPSAVARETLRQLSAHKLPPTPDNYARCYNAIARPGGATASIDPAAILRDLADELSATHGNELPEAVALRRAIDAGDWPQTRVVLKRLCAAPTPQTSLPTWAPLIRDLFQQWETRTPGMTQARKREALEHVLTAFASSTDGLYARLRGLVRSWADGAAVPATLAPPTADAAAGHAALQSADSTLTLWRELVAQTLTLGVVERLGYSPALALEAQKLATEARAVDTADGAAALASKLKRFWVTLELRGDDQREIQKGLLRLLHLLTANLAELAGDATWIRGQLAAVASLAQGPVDLETIGALERRLREVTMQQGVLKQSLDQAKDAMKQMMTTFIDRVSALASDTGTYHDKLARYATEIETATDLPKLSSLIVEVMNDTRAIQTDLGRSRDELMAARKSVEEMQARAVRLEGELSALSDRLHEDHLTQVLNRRGLERAFEIEASRADRYERPLSLAMLDIDNFKALNDRLGHQAGDLALVHLARIVRRSIRPSDIVSRYGGEEFVILLPETVGAEAVSIMTRVQRDLTRRFFLHNNERVLITFSAGVAQRVVGEGEEELIARADRALYHAKQTGKNRVVAA